MVVFARVVETRSFTVAARELGFTTSSVSRSVSRLEAHMGGKLLVRNTRAMSLTELGKEVFDACAEIAATARTVEGLAGRQSSSPKGVLKVSAATAYAQSTLVPQLTRFLALWPEMTVELDVTDRLVDIVAEGFDVVVRMSSSLPPGMVARPLSWSSALLVASPAYLRDLAPIETPQQLAAHPIILAERSGDDRGLLTLQHEEARESVETHSRLSLNNSMGALGAVRQKLGIGVVRDFAAKDALATGELVQVLPTWTLTGPLALCPVQAVYPPTRHVPPKVRAFIDFLVAENDIARAVLVSSSAPVRSMPVRRTEQVFRAAA